ncbi:unnamed protein product [Lepeophtheirus salmonis]|uniref:(salmon louse) hypothetical protein n=1 Tax=Lepeophtheirus salmonis TaxID=72036 RepID=A0A7R8H7U0_LEPSM|nr:unnamed protein product [Lepeophtheirus salmonis]CAF2925230.1 unnamed protein product [Lepeophtheirus salmonis]
MKVRPKLDTLNCNLKMEDKQFHVSVPILQSKLEAEDREAFERFLQDENISELVEVSVYKFLNFVQRRADTSFELSELEKSYLNSGFQYMQLQNPYVKNQKIKTILPTFRCKVKGPNGIQTARDILDGGPQDHFFRVNRLMNSEQEKSNPKKSTLGY